MEYYNDTNSSGYLSAYGNRTSPAFRIIERYSGTSTAPSHPSYAHARRTCVICLGEDVNSSLCVPTHRCTHSRCICSGCRKQYLHNMVCVQGVTRVTCPQPGCLQQFDEADIQKWGDSTTISRYTYLVSRRRTALDHLRSHASIPQPPRNKRADERASTEYIAANTKPCPACKSPIAKFGDGCDHMKCAPPGGCGFEFCWLCLCDFEPVRQDGNHRHQSSCKHYRPIC